MSAFVKRGGKIISTFIVWNEAGQKYKATERENLIRSSEVRGDGMSRKGGVETYIELERGGTLVRVEDKPDTFKVVETDEIVWKL